MTLEQAMKVALANTFAFYLKAHNFHWNTEGPNFPQYHKFLDDLYNEVWEAVDAVAEHIRALDMYAPGSFQRFQELATIKDQTLVPRAELMMEELLHDNQLVIESLEQAYQLADGHLGLQNFLQDRIDRHEKHGWMIRSIGRTSRA
jgi:starvation-inducible DNA-binding protein